MCGAAATQAYVTEAGRVHVAMFSDAGEATEVSYCNVLILRPSVSILRARLSAAAPAYQL